jgi:hypothetical protein
MSTGWTINKVREYSDRIGQLQSDANVDHGNLWTEGGQSRWLTDVRWEIRRVSASSFALEYTDL